MNAVAERKRTPANVALGPVAVVQPTSPSEIIEVLVNAKRFPSPVRPMGAGSSVTRCVTANSGTLLDLSEMNRVLKVTRDSVTVQPGIRLHELAETLANEGLELVGGFEFANRTAGGAVCGAGVESSLAGDVSQFAGHATQLKVIGPQGKRFVVTENTKSLLALMRLSYGLLGVVYEITLRVRPVQGFAVRSGKVSFKDFAKLGTRLGEAAAGVKLHLLPFSDVVFFELRERAVAGNKGASYASRLKDWAVYSALPTVVRSLGAIPVGTLRYPIIDKLSAATQSLAGLKPLQAGSNAAEQSGRYRALGAERFTHCTWAFPIAGISNVVLAYKLFCKEHYTRTGYRCDLPAVGFRLGRDRTALLSPSFEGAVLALSSLSTQDTGWDDFVLELAEFATSHGGIPMLNQTRNATPEHLAKCYGTRLKFFNKVRRELDPHDRLLNQFFASYLTGLA
jgi:hypothetical protein